MANFLLNTEEINRVNNEIHNYISTKKLPFSGVIMSDYDDELVLYIEKYFNEALVSNIIYSFLHSSVIALLPKSSNKLTELILENTALANKYKEFFGHIYFHQIENHQMQSYAMKYPSMIQNKDIFLWHLDSPVYDLLIKAKKESLSQLQLSLELNTINHAIANQMQAYVDTEKESEVMSEFKKINSNLFNKSYYASLCFLSVFQETIDNLKHTRPELIEKHRYNVKKRGLTFEKIQHSLDKYLSLYNSEKMDIVESIFYDVFLQYQNFNFPVINYNQVKEILIFCLKENPHLFFQKQDNSTNEPLSYLVQVAQESGEYIHNEKNKNLIENVIPMMSDIQINLFRQLIDHYLPNVQNESLQKIKDYWYSYLDKIKMQRQIPEKIKQQDDKIRHQKEMENNNKIKL